MYRPYNNNKAMEETQFRLILGMLQKELYSQ